MSLGKALGVEYCQEQQSKSAYESTSNGKEAEDTFPSTHVGHESERIRFSINNMWKFFVLKKDLPSCMPQKAFKYQTQEESKARDGTPNNE